jgi:division protein CdvB (Snf7/Vps24/ESCRT-III family)
MVKVTGTLQKSTEIMKLSNALVKLPQISHEMREMSMEMTKVGICIMDICNVHVLIGRHHGGNVGGRNGHRG